MALKKIGALWAKTNKNNKEYLSGELDLGAMGSSRIMVFQNDKKEKNHPDYSISLVTDDPAEAKAA